MYIQLYIFGYIEPSLHMTCLCPQVQQHQQFPKVVSPPVPIPPAVKLPIKSFEFVQAPVFNIQDFVPDL